MVTIPMPKGVRDTLTSGIPKKRLDCLILIIFYTTEDSCGELGLSKQIVSLLTNPSVDHIILNNQLLHLPVCHKIRVDEKAYHYFPGKIYSISHNTNLYKSIH